MGTVAAVCKKPRRPTPLHVLVLKFPNSNMASSFLVGSHRGVLTTAWNTVDTSCSKTEVPPPSILQAGTFFFKHRLAFLQADTLFEN
jgi:hypothetical protein